MLLTLLATVALGHDYILDALPDTVAGTPVCGIVAEADSRERRLERPSTLQRLDQVGNEVTPLGPARKGWGVATVAPDAVTAVVYENTGATIELPWDRFRHYVAHEGDARRLSVVDGLAHEPQREHYRRSLKLLLGVEAGHDGWDRVVGLPLELVPLDRPGSTQRMRVRLLASGAPVVGAKVRAFPMGGHADDDAVAAVTDTNGVATLALPRRGTDWVYAAVTMTHDPARSEPWHSVWTTLRTR